MIGLGLGLGLAVGLFFGELAEPAGRDGEIRCINDGVTPDCR